MPEECYLGDGDTLQFKPAAGWSWKGWNGQSSVLSTESVLTLGAAGVRDTDLEAMFQQLIGRFYIAGIYRNIPGLVLSATVRVTQDTLCPVATASGRPLGTQATRGTFEIVCTQAVQQEGAIGPNPDPNPKKSGTWEVVRTKQSVGVRGTGLPAAPQSSLPPAVAPGAVAPPPTPYQVAQAGAPSHSRHSGAPKSPASEFTVSYVDSQGAPISGASIALCAPDGEAIWTGTTNAEGVCVAPVLEKANSGIVVCRDPGGYVPRHITHEPNHVTEVTRGAFDQTWEWLVGAAAGDFNPEPTVGQSALNTLIGLVPIADQVLDLRDLIANSYKIIEYYDADQTEPDRPAVLGLSYENWLWIDATVCALGAIPTLGSALKGIFKITIQRLKAIGRPIGQLNSNELRELWSHAMAMLNHLSGRPGNAHRWLTDVAKDTKRNVETAIRNVQASFEAIHRHFADALKHAQQLSSANRFPGTFLQRTLQTVARILDSILRARSRLESLRGEIGAWLTDLLQTLVRGKFRAQHRATAAGLAAHVKHARRMDVAPNNVRIAQVAATDPAPADLLDRIPVPKRSIPTQAPGRPPYRPLRGTAGTGGIRRIHAPIRHSDGSMEYCVEGYVLPKATARREFEDALPNPSSIIYNGIAIGGYDRAHLWGAGFGDEAAEGIMYAPSTINKSLQGRIERRLREDFQPIEARGETHQVYLVATAISHPVSPSGVEVLHQAIYKFHLEGPGGVRSSATIVSVEIDPPVVGGRPRYRIEVNGVPF